MTSRRSFFKQAGLSAAPLLARRSSAAEPSAVAIWDLHCHILNAPGRTPEEKMEHLIEFADRMGIARFCLFKGARSDRDMSPEDLRKTSSRIAQVLALEEINRSLGGTVARWRAALRYRVANANWDK